MNLQRLILLLFAVISVGAFAQDDGGSLADFGLDLAIGAQSLPQFENGTILIDENGEPVPKTWQSIALTPDLGLGKFGIGLDLELNFTLSGTPEVRLEDWVPSLTNSTFLELYLPKFRYVRWGTKGEPLYALLGQVDNGLLGNGFIVGGYSNTQYMPDRKIFGASLDIDGQLFNFPYVGIETFAGNLAAFDIMGARLYVRPLAGTNIPILKNMQLGGTYAIDRDPFYFASKDLDAAALVKYLPEGADPADAVASMWGADVRIPVLSNPVVSLATFGDYVMQGENMGGMVGFGGRLFSFLPYRAELRFLGDNFVPNYFDVTYDLRRPERYARSHAVDSTAYATGGQNFGTDSSLGWFVRSGLALLDDQILFNAEMDGPFVLSDTGGSFADPHLRASLSVAEGLVGGFAFSASYDKDKIDEWGDLIDLKNDAVFGARIDYNVEGAVISLVYDLRPSPEAGGSPVITSHIETAFSLF